jgi:phosphoglycerol geranylgeranyltransferase
MAFSAILFDKKTGKTVTFAKTVYMKDNGIYRRLCDAQQKNKKQLAILIDPDKVNSAQVAELVNNAVLAGVDFFFVGGSLVMNNQTENWVATIKAMSDIPVILFPGSVFQITHAADALFFLSLVSGRNPDLLIGQHVLAAPLLYQSNLEIMPTGYLLIDGGKPTTVSYISNSTPIPADKPQIAVCTAIAAQLLGMKIIYLDSGSGALHHVSVEMVKEVKQHVNLPLIVGGGIRTPEQAASLCQAGADLVVVGNVLEKSPSLVFELAKAVHFTTN